MIFQLKNRLFTLGGSIDITDQDGTPCYQVRGNTFSFGGRKLDLFDMYEMPVAHIEQRLHFLGSEFDIYQQGQMVAAIKPNIFSFGGERFTVETMQGNLEVAGDWMNWNYTIAGNGIPIATVGKQFNFFQNMYGVNIADNAAIPLMLCIAIVIDEVVSGQRPQSPTNTIIGDIIDDIL